MRYIATNKEFNSCSKEFYNVLIAGRKKVIRTTVFFRRTPSSVESAVCNKKNT